MRTSHMKTRYLLIVVLALWPASAFAVIAAKLELFDTSAAIVRLKATEMTAANKLVDAAVIDVVVGEFAPKSVKVQIAQPEGAFAKIAVGSELMLFISRRGGGEIGVIHAADMWLDARLSPRKTGWVVQQERKEMYKNFPGTTAALSQLAADKKAGKPGMLEELRDNLIFMAKPVVLGAAPADTTALWAMDADETGKSILLADTPAGVKALKQGQTLTDVTTAMGLADVKGSVQSIISAGKDGKPRAVIGGKMYASDGKTFAIAAAETPTDIPPQSPAQSITTGRFGFGGALASLGVSMETISLYPPGADAKPVDFVRLTGQSIADYDKEKKGLKNATVRTLDVNGDGLDDALVIADDLGFLLVNRGYGCYFAAEVSVRNLRESAGFPITGKTPWTPARVTSAKHHDVVLMSPDGKLICVPASK